MSLFKSASMYAKLHRWTKPSNDLSLIHLLNWTPLLPSKAIYCDKASGPKSIVLMFFIFAQVVIVGFCKLQRTPFLPFFNDEGILEV